MADELDFGSPATSTETPSTSTFTTSPDFASLDCDIADDTHGDDTTTLARAAAPAPDSADSGVIAHRTPSACVTHGPATNSVDTTDVDGGTGARRCTVLVVDTDDARRPCKRGGHAGGRKGGE